MNLEKLIRSDTYGKPITPIRRPLPYPHSMPVGEQLQLAARLLVDSVHSYTDLLPLWDAITRVQDEYAKTLAPMTR